MMANPTLLQMKYARVIIVFAERAKLTLRQALDFFYQSQTAALLREGVSDLHCMSDGYIAQDLVEEYEARAKEMT